MVKRISLIVLLVVVALSLAACGSGNDDQDDNKPAATQAQNQPARTYTTLDVNQAYRELRQNSGAILVDVRQPEEWQQTGIPQNALTISLPTFQATTSGDIPGLPKDKPIYVICNSGNRSRVASEILINLGYQSVYNIDGGIQAWMQANLPTVPYTP